MERVWQWAWDRFGRRYSWVVAAVSLAALGPVFVFAAVLVVGFEGSDRWLEGAGIAVVTATAVVLVVAQPGSRGWRPIERWAAGDPLDRLEALESTYAFARGVVLRGLVTYAIAGGGMFVVVGGIAGATTGRSVQFGVLGAAVAEGVLLIAGHTFVESAVRPARTAIAGDSEVGDSLPRSRPSFSTWSNVAVVATAWTFTSAGAFLAAVIDQVREQPALIVVIAAGMTVCFAVPLTMAAALAPSLQPVRDLAEGTSRVAAGTTASGCPSCRTTTSARSWPRSTGCRPGWPSGSDCSPPSAPTSIPHSRPRLLEQGDDTFAGERREVTVMFVDIRDFTPFAEASTAEETVAQLNALFEIVVPAVLDAGGHVNKYLGDGAMAVFGAPNALAHHADAAVSAAVSIHQLVAERFGGSLRIGTGINTGQVIAGTIGGGGKLEFTLIGDTVNVAARVEQLTKETGDGILITDATRAALSTPRRRSTKRGAYELKGKSAAVTVHALAVPKAR